MFIWIFYLRSLSVLYYGGKDLRNLPLLERKIILDDLVKDYPSLQKVSFIETKGEELFEEIKRKNLEGIVAKRKSSQYVGRRSPHWLKIINWIESEAIITGYRKQDNGLICNHPDLTPFGIVLSGMSPVQREAFFKIAKTIKIGEDKDSVILEPILKCQLKGRGFTSKGIMRSPIFVDFIF